MSAFRLCSPFRVAVCSILSVGCALWAQRADWPHPGPSVNIYVSPAGKDAWSGLVPEPNESATDGPFQHFDRARL